jgi:hypothetical protein
MDEIMQNAKAARGRQRGFARSRLAAIGYAARLMILRLKKPLAFPAGRG